MAKPVNEVVENVKSLARTFQSVIDLANALEGMSSVEQAARAAELRLKKLRAESDAAQLEFTNASQRTLAVKAEAAQILADAHQLAERIKAQAEMDAGGFLADVQAKIERLQAEADAKRTTIFSECQEMEARRNLMAAELRTLEDRIAEAKAQIQKMLGA